MSWRSAVDRTESINLSATQTKSDCPCRVWISRRPFGPCVRLLFGLCWADSRARIFLAAQANKWREDLVLVVRRNANAVVFHSNTDIFGVFFRPQPHQWRHTRSNEFQGVADQITQHPGQSWLMRQHDRPKTGVLHARVLFLNVFLLQARKHRRHHGAQVDRLQFGVLMADATEVEQVAQQGVVAAMASVLRAKSAHKENDQAD